MSLETISVKAESRTATGKGAVGRLRRSGKLPAVIYGGKEPRNIQLDEHSFELLLHRHHSESLILDLSVDDGAPGKVLLKEVQSVPMSSTLSHVDFLEIDMSRTIKATVSLLFTGIPVGVSQEGGLMEILLRSIEVECLPGDLVEEFEIDISEMASGTHLTIGELPFDQSKYRPTSAPDVAVVSVATRRGGALKAGEEGENEAAS